MKPITQSLLNRVERDLKHEEGCRLRAYQDIDGWWTIGWGHLIDHRKGVCTLAEEMAFRENGISQLVADMMLREDIYKAVVALDSRLSWWRNLDEVRQSVMVNWTFNMGLGGVLTFKNTLRAIQSGAWDLAAQGMLHSKWARQVDGPTDDPGERGTVLAERMRTGVYES